MEPSLESKVCVVTGANRGIGKATSVCLARRGATVVMASRSKERGEAALSEVKELSGSDSVQLMICDLSSLSSVRHMAMELLKQQDKLYLLVNNAAVFTKKRQVTEDGLEGMFATNYLGPFLLTNLVLGQLKAGSPSGIVTLSAPSTTKLDFDDLQSEKRFSSLHAFGATKTADLLFTYELARRLEGTGVTANAYFPGVTKTDLMKSAPVFAKVVTSLSGKSPERAAEGLCTLTSSKQLEGITGKFLKGTGVSESNHYTRDPAVQQQLWTVSAKLAGLKG
jgi:NAD(P)-dependent dehydrogenase (short-subunit alcohol dehydrogenase family)